MPRTLLLNSGGTDSLFCANSLAGQDVVSVFIGLGHASDARSSSAARTIAEYYAFEHRSMSMNALIPAVNKAGFVSIPFQTQVLLTLAVSLAKSMGILRIVSGVHHGVMRNTPEKLMEMLSESYLNDWGGEFVFPVRGFATDDVVIQLSGHPLLMATQSCNREPRCSVSSPHDETRWCPKCQMRERHAIDTLA